MTSCRRKCRSTVRRAARDSSVSWCGCANMPASVGTRSAAPHQRPPPPSCNRGQRAASPVSTGTTPQLMASSSTGAERHTAAGAVMTAAVRSKIPIGLQGEALRHLDPGRQGKAKLRQRFPPCRAFTQQHQTTTRHWASRTSARRSICQTSAASRAAHRIRVPACGPDAPFGVNGEKNSPYLQDTASS